MINTKQNMKPIIISPELKAKLAKRGSRIWNFSEVRLTQPFTKFLTQKDLVTFVRINKVGLTVEKFPEMILKHQDKEILNCSVRFNDDKILLSISDVETGEILETKPLNRGYDKGVDFDFYSVKIISTDEVEKRIVFNGNGRASLKEEINQTHFILFSYEEE